MNETEAEMRSDTADALAWRYAALAIGLIVSVAGGAIWLGSLTNQISVNTRRLDRIEGFMDEVRQHDANTTARLAPIERRLEQLETWQYRVKNGETK